ncbi:MAG: ferredoxin [Nitriliruptoraceae bacterium]|nr:ferredoxin [Nitriliruptoraceae bacterium]
MHVTVDERTCEAYGICAMTAPEVFEVDTDAGHARVLDPTPDPALQPLALEAQQACPVAAITVTTGPAGDGA